MHDAVESQTADHSDSNSLGGLSSLTSSEPTGVTTASTPTEEQGNDAYIKGLEREARERGSPPSTSSGIASTDPSQVSDGLEWMDVGERLHMPRQPRQDDVPVMRDIVHSSSERASEEQGHEKYMEELNKEARQRNYDKSSSDASFGENVGGDAELPKSDDGSEKLISPLEGCERQARETSEPSSSSSKIGSGNLRKTGKSEKWLNAGKNITSFDDSEKREEKKSSFAKDVECSIKDQKPGPQLKVKISTTEEETVEPFGIEEPVPTTDPTLKESEMSPKQMEVGSPVEPEFVAEKRDVPLKNVPILQSDPSGVKTPDLETTNLHGNETVQSTSRHGRESELTPVHSRASHSEPSNIKVGNTDTTVSSTVDPMSSTILELGHDIKGSTECIELDEASKTDGTRKSWQKSGSLYQLQHTTVSSMDSTEEERAATSGIEEPITDVEIAKSPEEMDVSFPSPGTIDPERDILHEMDTMQSAPEHGLASKFQSEESRKEPSDASDFKDGRPDSRLSSSSAEPFSTSSEFSHGLGSSIESSESEGTTMLRSAPKSSPKQCSQHKIQYATIARIETIEEETVAMFETEYERNVEHQIKDSGMSSGQMEIGSPVEREFAPESTEKDKTVRVQSESSAPERSLSGSETKRPSISIPVSKSEKQSSKPERKQATSAMATGASKSGKRSRKKARIDKDKKIKHPASPKKRVRRRSSGSVSESTGELSGSGTDSDYSVGN
ncbi:hypothetical protein TNCV_1756211 [Trichonephila clavipes]|nr:hypothetical protein TNCV_1756211 [Trichonephila clavipes]